MRIEDEARRPTPHGDKLRELANNEKLPRGDLKRLIKKATPKYEQWIQKSLALKSTGEKRVRELAQLLNDYKRSLELEFIWDSDNDFLYRQRGQLKLDGSILEEFLPFLADERIIPALKGHAFTAGPQTAFAAAYFTSSLRASRPGMMVRTKDQDFTIGRVAYLAASHDPTFPKKDTTTAATFLAFVAAECKTNLDKTMFQEAIATAHDLKSAILGSRYYLICEWLDMTPISTAATDIDKVIILRGKRIGSGTRSAFASSNRRKDCREWYATFLMDNPIRAERIKFFTDKIQEAFTPKTESEDSVLSRGYF